MTYAEASDRIKQLAFYYQGVLELADALAEAGTLDATIVGLRAQREEGERALAEVQTQRQEQIEALEAARVAADAMLLDAKEQAAVLVDEATASAARLVDEARREAERCLNEERDSREAVLETVTQKVLATQLALADLQAQATNAMGAQQEAMRKLTETQAELDLIQSRARKLLETN